MNCVQSIRFLRLVLSAATWSYHVSRFRRHVLPNDESPLAVSTSLTTHRTTLLLPKQTTILPQLKFQTAHVIGS